MCYHFLLTGRFLDTNGTAIQELSSKVDIVAINVTKKSSDRPEILFLRNRSDSS